MMVAWRVDCWKSAEWTFWLRDGPFRTRCLTEPCDHKTPTYPILFYLLKMIHQSRKEARIKGEDNYQLHTRFQKRSQDLKSLPNRSSPLNQTPTHFLIPHGLSLLFTRNPFTRLKTSCLLLCVIWILGNRFQWSNYSLLKRYCKRFAPIQTSMQQIRKQKREAWGVRDGGGLRYQ